MEGRTVFVPLLIDINLDVNVYIPGMNALVNEFKQKDIRLLDEYFYENGNHENFFFNISPHVCL